MQLKQLLKIYPQAITSHHPQDPNKYLNLKIDNQWVSLPQKDLSTKEIQLLKAFSDSMGMPQKLDLQTHPWFNFLLANGPMPSNISEKVRFIQAFVMTDDDRNEWSKSFKTTFSSSNILDSFWISPQKYVLIEQINDDHYSQNDFTGIAETLDINLNTKTRFFIGSYWKVTPQLASIFDEELKIANYTPTKAADSAISISQVAINYWLNNYIKKSDLFNNYKQQFTLSDQMKKIITTLYTECGNLSSTAKKLYVHRNTLQYQLEKFYHQTGLNLKNMNDLVFCYLLTI